MRRMLNGRGAGLAALAPMLLLLAPAVAQPGPAGSGHGAVPALYATQAEAEQAARLHFNCTGAHRMGNQWMPCSGHGAPRSGSVPAAGHSH